MHKERVAPSERIRKEIGEIMEGVEGEKNPLEEVLQRAKVLIIQELLEGEVDEYLQRGRYQRRGEGSRTGYRNGYEPKGMKTPEGKLTVEIPQVRDTEEPYRSRLKEFLTGNTEVLETLAAEMYCRGLSTRDIEEALYSATGEKVLSRSSVSRVTEVLWEEYQGFISRDLSVYDIAYLVVDAVYESIRPYIHGNQALLVAYGITTEGKKVLLHMELGNKESAVFCGEFFRGMLKRGMNIPVSVTSDGALGLTKAIDEIFPLSLRVRCWVHKIRNLAVKLPDELWRKIKPEVLAIRDSLTYEEGKSRLDAMVAKYRRAYPSFVHCLLDDHQALLNILHIPHAHRKTVRSTNLVERIFVEERRRTKIIPRFLTEQACLKLTFSVLYRASYRWKRIPMSDDDRRQIEALRQKLGIVAEAPENQEKVSV